MNLIDLLKKGNLELFHSSMIAWLLTDNSIHGLGNLFLQECLKILSLPLATGTYVVTTESKSRKKRYDIVIDYTDIDGKRHRIILENKIKAIGCTLQLASYQKAEKAFGLGFTEYNFVSSQREPMVTYRDLTNVYKTIKKKLPSNKYSMLIHDYFEYIERELDFFQILKKYVMNDISFDKYRMLSSKYLQENETYLGENDYRYMCFYSLSVLGQVLYDSSYQVNKDMIGGPWLMINKPKLEGKKIKSVTTRLWIHINIDKPNGFFTYDEPIGKICLRTTSKGVQCTNRQLYQRLVDFLPSASMVIKDNWDDFNVYTEPLHLKDLQHERLPVSVQKFIDKIR